MKFHLTEEPVGLVIPAGYRLSLCGVMVAAVQPVDAELCKRCERAADRRIPAALADAEVLAEKRRRALRLFARGVFGDDDLPL